MVKSPIIPTPRHPRDGSSSSRTTAPTAATITIQRVAQHHYPELARLGPVHTDLRRAHGHG